MVPPSLSCFASHGVDFGGFFVKPYLLKKTFFVKLQSNVVPSLYIPVVPSSTAGSPHVHLAKDFR